jgi:hypothetical protein
MHPGRVQPRWQDLDGTVWFFDSRRGAMPGRSLLSFQDIPALSITITNERYEGSGGDGRNADYIPSRCFFEPGCCSRCRLFGGTGPDASGDGFFPSRRLRALRSNDRVIAGMRPSTFSKNVPVRRAPLRRFAHPHCPARAVMRAPRGSVSSATPSGT